MIKYSLVGAICLFLASQAQASWAENLFEERQCDFGTVPRGPVLSHSFRVVNTTGGTVTIGHVRVSCGICSAAHALNTVLAPGQETAVVVTMDTRRFSGHKSITVSVQFNQPRFAEVRLPVQAVSREDIAFSADSLDLGKVQRGRAANGSINVSLFGMPTTKVIDARCDSNYVLPNVQEVVRDGGEVSYRISATMRGDAPAGKWFTDLWLRTNNASLPKLRVPVMVEVESSSVPVAPAVATSTVALGQFKAGERIERSIILRGVRPFRILAVNGNDDGVQVRPTENETKAMHVLNVRLFAATPGELNHTIRIQTDLNSGGDIVFNASARVVP